LYPFTSPGGWAAKHPEYGGCHVCDVILDGTPTRRNGRLQIKSLKIGQLQSGNSTSIKFEGHNFFGESDGCVQSVHIVAIDNIMYTIIFITIGAGAVVTPKMLPIYWSRGSL
jgi:hypothetical protein